MASLRSIISPFYTLLSPALHASGNDGSASDLSSCVIPFTITTPDRESLFAWFLWLSVPWRTNVEKRCFRSQLHRLLTASPSTDENAARSASDSTEPALLDQLKGSNTKCLIFFHGNAGDVAEPGRIKFYNKLLSTCPDTDPAFLIAVDYRGFGQSSGTPTECGCRTDGIATVYFALDRLKIPAHRIVLVGHSLGTAIATATYEYFIAHTETHLGGLVLASGFTDVPSLLTEYRLFGLFPVLKPVDIVPGLLKGFQSLIIDKWETRSRLITGVRDAERCNVLIVHARNDAEIPCVQSERLFDACVCSLDGSLKDKIDETTEREDGLRRKRLGMGTKKSFQLMLLPLGGHNGSIIETDTCHAIYAMFDNRNT
ncbi:MAG: hypothetical protein Q9159_000501 [Coniocarpon cinnabarinum]